MSQQATLPDPQTAYDNLFQAVHARVFFQKCASAGIMPRSRQEAQWMLETAGKLRTVDQAGGLQKDAQDDNDNPYYQMNRHLDQVLAQHGLDGGIKAAAAQEEESAIRQLTVDLSNDPLLYNSVLSLKTAEAQDIQQQYEAWKRQNQGAAA